MKLLLLTLFFGVVSVVHTINVSCPSWKYQLYPDLETSDYPLIFPQCNGTFTLRLMNTGNLPNSAFIGIRIQKLVIEESTITSIAENAFSGHEDTLKVLHISTLSKAVPAPTKSLENLYNLEELKVTNFVLNSKFNEINFANLSRLQSLHLEDNSLWYFDRSVFNGLSELTRLRINHNQFTSIPLPSVFADLQNLTYLDMSDNKIEKITGYNLVESKKLEHLVLVKNAIVEIEKDAFKGLEKSLKVLNLKLNILKQTQLMNITDALSLRELNLQSNKIQVLPSGLFKNFNFLQTLILKDNKLNYIKNGSFQGLKSLKTLQLDFNHLTVETGTLLDTPQLEEIYFKKQETLLNMEWVQDVAPSLLKLYVNENSFNITSLWPAIKSLTKLEYLSLSDCNLGYIPDFAFEQNRKLQTLKLDKNGLQVLRQETFQGLQESLVSVNLNFNNLETIDECVFQNFNWSLQQDTFLISLYGNDLVCNCSLLWLQEWTQIYLAQMKFHFIQFKIWKCNGSTEYNQANLTCVSNSTNQTCQDFSDRYTTIAPTATPYTTSIISLLLTTNNDIIISTTEMVPSTPMPQKTTIPQTTVPSTIPQTTVPSTISQTTVPSTTQTPEIPSLFLRLEKLSSSSSMITWNVSSWEHVQRLTIIIDKNVENVGKTTEKLTRSQDDPSHEVLSNLKMGTILNVCIRVKLDFFWKILDKCDIIRFLKTSKEDNKNAGIYIGIGVGAAILVTLLLILVGVMCYSRNKSTSSLDKSEASLNRPKMTQRSKRYQKRKNPSSDTQVSVISVEPFQPMPRISAGSYQYLADPNLTSPSTQQAQPSQPGFYENKAFSESIHNMPEAIERNNNQRKSAHTKRPLPNLPGSQTFTEIFQPKEPIYVNVQPHYAEIPHTETIV